MVKTTYRKKNTVKKYIKKQVIENEEEPEYVLGCEDPSLIQEDIKIESEDEIVITPEIDTDVEEEKEEKIPIKIQPEEKKVKKTTLSQHLEGYLINCIGNYLMKLIKQPINYEKQREKVQTICQFQHKKYQIKISIVNTTVVNKVYDKIVEKLTEEKNKMEYLKKIMTPTKEKFLICQHIINDKVNEMEKMGIVELITEEYKMEIEKFV